MKLLVSACLLGVGCRYDGKSNQLPQYKRLLKEHTCIPVCPEQLGGLPTPRCPAERLGGKIVTEDGRDVTEQYRCGAAMALELAKTFGCTVAVLKEKSPSCGSGRIYDGTFTRTLTAGDGVTAELLKNYGITVVGESQIEKFLSQALT